MEGWAAIAPLPDSANLYLLISSSAVYPTKSDSLDTPLISAGIGHLVF